MKNLRLVSVCVTLANAAFANIVVSERGSSNNTATVDLTINNGSPQHLAAGFIYGIPDAEGQIPHGFYSEMGFNYGRAGGAQLPAPSRGWIWGLNEYTGRFRSTLSNYRTTRKHKGSFIILPHDLWGTDNANASTVWPGDNGDFSDYDAFLTQLFKDIKAQNMLPGLVFDIWNEPDGVTFWNRSQTQWLDLYVHSHKFIRSDPSLRSMLISGPTLASPPSPSNTWWTKWLHRIKTKNAIPDQYAWHLEGDIIDPIDDLQTNNATFTKMLARHNLPQRQVNINEYATFAEQVAAGAAWWIARLERYDAYGLRGNWLSLYSLHDFMASLLRKPHAGTSAYNPTGRGYHPNGEWQVYRYYNLNMTGARAGTTGSGDRLMDVYATVGDKVRILTGVRLQTGTWYITVDGLSAVGLPGSGTLDIQTYGFVDEGHFGAVDAPTDRGIVSHTYSGNSVTFPVFQTDQDEYTAWGFEFETSS